MGLWNLISSIGDLLSPRTKDPAYEKRRDESLLKEVARLEEQRKKGNGQPTFVERVLEIFPSSWFEKPVLSPTSKSLVFSSENKAMSILGCQEKPQLKEYVAAPQMHIRIIDQHFILISAKNKINDQIVSLRKRTDKKDFFSSIFKPTQEEKGRLAMLESKQKTIPEYEFPYFVIISGPEYETVEDEAKDLAARTQGKVLSFQTLIVAYETAAWDQCKDVTHPVGQ